MINLNLKLLIKSEKFHILKHIYQKMNNQLKIEKNLKKRKNGIGEF